MIDGIHHITGLVTSPQRDYTFYTQVLGLRLIKKTVNQDNPKMWHFFYGDHDGNVGTIMTNIILEGVPMSRCEEGRGTIEALSFSVERDSLDYWRERLSAVGYPCSDRPERFGDPVLHFRDPEGLSLELIGCDDPRVRASGRCCTPSGRPGVAQEVWAHGRQAAGFNRRNGR